MTWASLLKVAQKHTHLIVLDWFSCCHLENIHGKVYVKSRLSIYHVVQILYSVQVAVGICRSRVVYQYNLEIDEWTVKFGIVFFLNSALWHSYIKAHLIRHLSNFPLYPVPTQLKCIFFHPHVPMFCINSIGPLYSTACWITINPAPASITVLLRKQADKMAKIFGCSFY